uniref:SPRY domain-containing protein n=1 Tax=Poecilia reticulata TaxID=8081 RepID=A0A3P9NWV3_POERE
MEARTVSFSKNGEEPKLAFEDVDAAELFPCVMFYSSNPGEKVKICDMQMRGTPRDLLPGDPVCSPTPTVLVEATAQLVRILHRTDRWTPRINSAIIQRLQKIKPCFRDAAAGGPQTGRHATLLGVAKEGSSSAKVQWDEAEITIRYRNRRTQTVVTQTLI